MPNTQDPAGDALGSRRQLVAGPGRGAAAWGSGAPGSLLALRGGWVTWAEARGESETRISKGKKESFQSKISGGQRLMELGRRGPVSHRRQSTPAALSPGRLPGLQTR